MTDQPWEPIEVKHESKSDGGGDKEAGAAVRPRSFHGVFDVSEKAGAVVADALVRAKAHQPRPNAKNVLHEAARHTATAVLYAYARAHWYCTVHGLRIAMTLGFPSRYTPEGAPLACGCFPPMPSTCLTTSRSPYAPTAHSLRLGRMLFPRSLPRMNSRQRRSPALLPWKNITGDPSRET